MWKRREREKGRGRKADTGREREKKEGEKGKEWRKGSGERKKLPHDKQPYKSCADSNDVFLKLII